MEQISLPGHPLPNCTRIQVALTLVDCCVSVRFVFSWSKLSLLSSSYGCDTQLVSSYSPLNTLSYFQDNFQNYIIMIDLYKNHKEFNFI